MNDQINVIGATAPFEKETYDEMVKYSNRYKDYHNNIIVFPVNLNKDN